MHDAKVLNEYSFTLTQQEAEYLNAAVTEFFHRMRTAVGDGFVPDFEGSRYQTAVSLWNKVEAQILVKERK